MERKRVTQQGKTERKTAIEERKRDLTLVHMQSVKDPKLSIKAGPLFFLLGLELMKTCSSVKGAI